MVGRRTVAIFTFTALSLLAAAGFNIGRVTYADVQQTVDQAWGALPSTMIERAVDGDTVELVDGTRLRYIGIDTPELNTGRGTPDCLAEEAAKYNASMVEGKTVVLEYDTDKTDKYGRDLAYVWLDGEMVNERLVAAGYATVYTVQPNSRYVDRFLAAERSARNQGLGLWAAGSCYEAAR